MKEAEGFNPLAELPLGFGMTLVQNASALEYFSQLEPGLRDQVVARAHHASSRKEIKNMVSALGRGTTDFL